MLSRDKIAKLCEKFITKRQEKLSDWTKIARPKQLMPEGEWLYWLILAGRGFGKTRTGAETIKILIEKLGYRNAALIGQNVDEVKKIMVEGVSGLIQVCNNKKLRYEKAKNRLIWSNGAVANFYGGDFFEKLRGPQFDCAWIDELAKFRYPNQCWDQLMLGLRLGQNPKCIITTTPRSIPLIKKLRQDPKCHVTTGNTFENQENLAATFLQNITSQFSGTRLGAQELYAEILEEKTNSLWGSNRPSA